MDRTPAEATRARGAGLVGSVLGHGLCRLKPSDSKAMRRRPGPVPEGWERVPPTLLRYSDEQTVAGVAAVFAAIAGMELDPELFADWGVVAASRFLGRVSLAGALKAFEAEGVWGTSPHLIPHFALHSLSGTISLAVGLKGPNLGVGGGIFATAEGFLTALTWLASGLAPGVWLVLSGWSPERVPESSEGGAPKPEEGECHALALALTAATFWDEGNLPSVQLRTSVAAGRVLAAPDLPWLAERLETKEGTRPRTIATDQAGRLRVELVPASAGRGAQDEHKDMP
jgi:hypothetical protein